MKISVAVIRDGRGAGVAVSDEVNLAGLETKDLQDAARKLAKELERKAAENRKQKEA